MSAPLTPATPRLPGMLVASGGALFAVGNIIHPLEHNDAGHAAATWEAAHLTFGLGGLLIAAGLPLLVAVGRVIRRSAVATTGAVLLAIAFAGLAPGAWFEAFVAPLPGGVAETVEGGAGGTVNAVMGFTWILATLVFGIAMAWRGERRSVRWAGGALLLAVVTMLVGPGIPVAEGLWIIPASALVGLALAIPAFASLRRLPVASADPVPAAADRPDLASMAASAAGTGGAR